MNPVISINIPCYNRKEMLKECIEYFINQTFTDWELVIIDDGSEDDISFVSDMDKRVKYIRQEHLGISKAFNLALDNSIGEYIMPFGSDDLATHPDFLDKILKCIKAYPKYDVIYVDFWIRKSNGQTIRKKNCKTLNDKEAYNKMLTSQYIPHPGTLWKKNKIPRYDESLESAVDWELFLTAMENGIRFKHRRGRLWTYRTGHQREFNTERQNKCCDIILRKRGFYFDVKTRKGVKICS